MVGDAVEQIKDQAKNFTHAKIDSAKQRAKDTLSSLKEQVKDNLKDKLKEQLLGKETLKKDNPADTNKKKTGTVFKESLKDILNRKKTGNRYSIE